MSQLFENKLIDHKFIVEECNDYCEHKEQIYLIFEQESIEHYPDIPWYKFKICEDCYKRKENIWKYNNYNIRCFYIKTDERIKVKTNEYILFPDEINYDSEDE